MNLGCFLLLVNLAPFEINFKESIAPLLVTNCIECHNSSVTKGTLNLETLASTLKGGDEGKALVLGKPEESQLYLKIIEGENKKKPEMPRKKPALAKADVEKIKAWIEQGAAWPKEIVLKEKAKADGSFWSFKPIAKVTPPVFKDAPDAWKINPIDAFVFSKLKEKGIKPSPVADKRSLIRRITLDLIGLPPTSSEVADFLNDENPEAYERVVDRLLASPRYGERWARHWLDVARFSESDGFEEDMQRPLAYTFRDYVIGALNQDKPYDEFVREQIAGDVQTVQNGDSIAATGFLVAGPWDAVQRVTPSKLGRLQSREEQLEEIVSGVSQAFLGLTVQCARCHDHKFDPISQEDYYRVKAVFEGVDHSLKIKAHGLRSLGESGWAGRKASVFQSARGLSSSHQVSPCASRACLSRTPSVASTARKHLVVVWWVTKTPRSLKQTQVHRLFFKCVQLSTTFSVARPSRPAPWQRGRPSCRACPAPPLPRPVGKRGATSTGRTYSVHKGARMKAPPFIRGS